MEKFVKDKLKTAKMQPLPQTWDNIEAVLDKDKKAWYRRRILFIALFLVVGAGALFTMSPQNSNEPETISSESKNEKFDDLAIEEERLTNSKMELQAPSDIKTELDAEINPIQESKEELFSQRQRKLDLNQGKFATVSDAGPSRDVSPQGTEGPKRSSLTKLPSSITTLEALTIDEVPYILGSFINLADLPDSNISSSDVDPIEDEYFGKNFSVEPSIGLARSFYFNKVKDYEFLNDRPGYGFDFQVLGGMSLSEKLTINTGLRYVNYTWGSNVGQSREAERDSFNGSPGYVIEPNSSYESGALLETVSYLKYLSVPTTLNYIILDNKLKVTLGLGLSTDWLISANVIEYYPGFESYVGVSSNTKEVNATNGFIGSSVSQPDNSDLLRKFSLSYHIQAPIYYELKENIHLVATPYGNLQGSNFITSSYSQRKAYNYGLRLGVKLDL